MGRPYGSGRVTCESCISIDVRRWHREGRLHAGQHFSWSWTCGGKPSGSIKVRTETDAVILMYRARSWGNAEWKSVEQRVPITWTACHLGGHRPWFICSVYSNGRYCGRRVAVLYIAGELFACRRCYGLAYASQREALHHRGIGKAQKIRMRLGGSPNMREAFPDKPKGMHWRTYDRLRRMHDVAEERSAIGLMRVVERLGRRLRAPLAGQLQPTPERGEGVGSPPIPPPESNGADGASANGPGPTDSGAVGGSAGASAATPSEGTVASVKFIITHADKARLRERGYSTKQIARLTPQEAGDILAQLERRSVTKWGVTFEVIGPAAPGSTCLYCKSAEPDEIGAVMMVSNHGRLHENCAPAWILNSNWNK